MKETWDKTMQERTDICARAEEMVAYLYGEATAAEALDFKRHTEHCAACRVELAAFGDVRDAIGEWRQQSLVTFTSPVSEANVAFAPAKATVRAKRSALAALREFFTLSPVWMRAATAVAAVVFCALAIIAVAYFKDQPQVLVVEKPNQADGPEKDKTERVAEKNEQKEDQKVEDRATPQTEVLTANGAGPKSIKPIKRRAPAFTQLQVKQRKAVPRTVDQSPEEMVADYLPFTASRPDAKLPTLADLADDSN